MSENISRDGKTRLTMVLKLWRSSGVIVSALAMTGIRLTRVPSFFMISTSSGFNLPSCKTQKETDI